MNPTRFPQRTVFDQPHDAVRGNDAVSFADVVRRLVCHKTYIALIVILVFSGSSFSDRCRAAERTLILVTGAPGAEEFRKPFAEWTTRIAKSARSSGVRVHQIGTKAADSANRDQLQKLLASAATKSSAELWLIFIGHGTFDGRAARFNLRGPDVSAQQLAEWLQSVVVPTAIVNCASSSAPFINRLSAPHRVVLTATKSGAEQNFARFGDYFSSVISSPEADLDKDGQTSLLEAFLLASRRTAEFYATEGRLATEHALLDDNGDERGSRSDQFRGIRPINATSQKPDGRRAHQFHLVRSQSERAMPESLRKQRDQLEQTLFQLRDRRKTMTEDEYLRQLEPIMVQLAKLYEQAQPKKPSAAK